MIKREKINNYIKTLKSRLPEEYFKEYKAKTICLSDLAMQIDYANYLRHKALLFPETIEFDTFLHEDRWVDISRVLAQFYPEKLLESDLEHIYFYEDLIGIVKKCYPRWFQVFEGFRRGDLHYENREP